MTEILDPALAAGGTRKIDWAADHAPVLREIRNRLRDDGSVKDRRIGVVLALEPKTALLARILAESGAEVRLTCSAIMTHDDVAAGLAASGVEVFARSDAGPGDEERFRAAVLAGRPEVLIDDMAELIRMAHTSHRDALADLTGASEETTSGVTLLRAMERDGALQVPCIAANDARCKYLFDNRYGSGQSVMMALLDATNLLLAGTTVLVVGYGWVGRGIARTARGLGARVVVAEVDPFAALEAYHDGHEVAPVADACERAAFVVTATGCRHALPVAAIERCPDGTVIANGGGPPDEIDVDGLTRHARAVRPARPGIDEFELAPGRSVFLVGRGQCANLSAGEGHPIEIMDLTFAVQALSARHLALHASEMPAGVHRLPPEIDEEIARLELAGLGVRFDELTAAQQEFLGSWGASRLKVLITGGTGVFGRAVGERLSWLGADVVAMARREQPLPAGVRFVAGDVRELDSVARAMDGCDAVVHTAWTVESLADRATADAIDLGGTANVLDAMAQTDTPRLVFTSSVTAYGSDPEHPQRYREDEPLRPDPAFAYGANKALAEAMIDERAVPAVIVRAAATLGRGVDNIPAHTFAGPALVGVTGEVTPWQLVHQDDVARFCAEAAAGSLATRTGTVNLAADDVLSLEELAEALGRPVRRLPEAAVRRMLETMWRLHIGEVQPVAFEALRCMPVADTTRLHEEWGFECVWSSLETARDAARSMRRHVYLGKFRVQVPWRLPYPDPHSPAAPSTSDGTPLVAAAADGASGEFDTMIDPRFDTFTATNLSEAFGSEPMTPLSLTVSLDALQSTGPAIADQLALTGDAAHETRERIVGAFGHRIYLNVSAARETAKQLPGSSPADIDRQYLGIPVPPGERTRLTAADLTSGARVLRRLGPQVAGIRREMERLELDAASLRAQPDEIAAWSDEALLSRIRLLHDVVATGWQLVTLANQVVGALTAVVERAAGPEAVSAATGSIDDLASATALRSVAELAAAARAEPAVATLLRDRAPTDAYGELANISPRFADQFEAVLAQVGHRGPGETELENPTFADAPELLVESVAKTLDVTPRPSPARRVQSASGRRLVRALGIAMRRRERIRDAVVVITDALRRAVRERGRRLAAQETLASPDDVFYLSYSELLSPPADATAVVKRRRAERTRLAAVRVPPIFEGRWDNVEVDTDPLPVGEALTGIPAAPGVARGRVRVMREFGDPIDPGDVLVANVTDTGWTPLFGFAAAVVTDVGGLVSHPAVVAREFGIPCVVGTNAATTRLRDGMTVEVDGTAGTVTVVEST